MELKEVLLHKTKANDIVIVRDCGQYIGMTFIDYEDLFINSLSNWFLNLPVKSYYYETGIELFRNVMIVDIE